MRKRFWIIPLAGLLIVAAAGLVWLQHGTVKLTRGPYLQNVSTAGVTICWHAEPDAPAKIAVRGEGIWLEREVAPADSPAITREYRIDGLQPGTRYEYTFSLGWGNKVRGAFQTAPPGDQPARFVIWGDSRSNPDVCRQIAEQILKTGVGMTIHSGDFARTGRDARKWNREFFEPCGDLMRHVVLFAAIGNHELTGSEDLPDGYQVYRDLLSLPGNELYYSFNYGMVHFVVLDSNGKHSTADAQYAWTRQDLTGSDARWKVVVFHHPIYSSGAHASNITMRTTYAPLFAQTNVDLIVVGHDHNYQLSRPIRHLSEPAQQHPYVQVVSGGGGAPLYAVNNDQPWSLRGAGIYNWMLVDANAERMQCTVYRPDGSEYDRFEIRKDQPLAEPVAYEWIQQLESLAMAQAVNANGQPLRTYFDALDTPLTVFVRLANMLPESIRVRLALHDAPKWDVRPGREEYALPPAAPGQPQTPIMAHLVISPRSEECFRPRPRLKLLVESKYGKREVLGQVLQVTMRRTAEALPAAGAVRVDGVLDEPLWQQAKTLSPFVYAGAGNEFEVGDDEATTVSVCYDGDALLFGIHAESHALESKIGQRINDSDYLRLFVGSQNDEAEVWIDLTNRQRASSEEIEAASRQQADGWDAEIRLPWSVLGLTSPPIDLHGLYLNIVRMEADQASVWSPTFGAAPNSINAGRLMISK
jgi:hypothetical protein